MTSGDYANLNADVSKAELNYLWSLRQVELRSETSRQCLLSSTSPALYLIITYFLDQFEKTIWTVQVTRNNMDNWALQVKAYCVELRRLTVQRFA